MNKYLIEITLNIFMAPRLRTAMAPLRSKVLSALGSKNLTAIFDFFTWVWLLGRLQTVIPDVKQRLRFDFIIK
jgi:hypothetical protein